MKNIIILLISFCFTIASVQAATFDVLVIPADLLNNKENYYGFEKTSEIFANDIIKNFNSSGGKVQSPDLYTVKAKLNSDAQLKKTAQATLDLYKTQNKIDYASLKSLGDSFSCKSVILISSSAITNKNSLKRDLWEVLEVSSQLNFPYPYQLQTSIVLIDTVNDIIMWSNSYSTKIGNNSNIFASKNFAQANEEYEKISLYSKNILALSATQNMMLRFFPKSIRPIEQQVNGTTGDALRFERTIPEKPILRPREDFYGDMLYGI